MELKSIIVILGDLEKRINDLQKDKDGLIQTLNVVSASVEGLTRRVSMLEEALATKVDITHTQQINKQSELIKRINESESVGMDSMVKVQLDGRTIAESVVKQTTDGFESTVNTINRTKESRGKLHEL